MPNEATFFLVCQAIQKLSICLISSEFANLVQYYAARGYSMTSSLETASGIQAGRDLRKSLVQYPAQSSVKAEFRPGCSQLYPVSSKGMEIPSTVTLGSLFQYLIFLTDISFSSDQV